MYACSGRVAVASAWGKSGGAHSPGWLPLATPPPPGGAVAAAALAASIPRWTSPLASSPLASPLAGGAGGTLRLLARAQRRALQRDARDRPRPGLSARRRRTDAEPGATTSVRGRSTRHEPRPLESARCLLERTQRPFGPGSRDAIGCARDALRWCLKGVARPAWSRPAGTPRIRIRIRIQTPRSGPLHIPPLRPPRPQPSCLLTSPVSAAGCDLTSFVSSPPLSPLPGPAAEPRKATQALISYFFSKGGT